MKIYEEKGIRNFDVWGGAIYTKDKILEHHKEDEFDSLIEELYPDGIEDTQLNDILWFDDEWVFECLNITEDEDEEDFD